MDLISVVIYGFVQGLTEFLPVSSSGHLTLLPDLLKIKPPGVLFDLYLHVGTATAALVYFQKQIILLISKIFQSLNIGNNKVDSQAWYGRYIVISTLTTVIVLLFIQKIAAEFRSPNVVGFNLILFGILMWLADRFPNKNSESEKMQKPNSYLKAIAIGLFQAIAVFPGISRSGATLTISRFIGLSRAEATHYSFLLAIPIIFAGALAKLPEILIEPQHLFDWTSCLLGIGVSFLVGFIAIHFFLHFVRKIGLFPFALYRVFLGLAVLFYFNF